MNSNLLLTATICLGIVSVALSEEFDCTKPFNDTDIGELLDCANLPIFFDFETRKQCGDELGHPKEFYSGLRWIKDVEMAGCVAKKENLINQSAFDFINFLNFLKKKVDESSHFSKLIEPEFEKCIFKIASRSYPILESDKINASPTSDKNSIYAAFLLKCIYAQLVAKSHIEDINNGGVFFKMNFDCDSYLRYIQKCESW